MGPGETATETEIDMAYALGAAIAQQGWALLTGGRAAGVMAAASRGARAHQGLVVGILPDPDPTAMSSFVDIAICTGMGQGRNVINVLSSQVIVACGLGAGTLSEIALAIKLQKPLILMLVSPAMVRDLQKLSAAQIALVSEVDDAIAHIQQALLLHP